MFPSSSSSAYYYYSGGGASSAGAAAAASFRPVRPSFSNVTIALVLSVPLALAGVAAAHASSSGGGGGIASEARPHGLLSPPVNEFLKEERRARVAPSRLVPAFREWGRGWWAQQGR